jgi:hypothetical protein
MSFDAVYNVTRAVRMFLHSQLLQVSPAAVVTLLPPGDKLPEVSGVNFYLYRVNESPFTKNQPWRGDRVTPPSDRPPLGLQLYYLLTPLAKPPDDSSFALGDDAHTMLGAAMSALQENPILNRVHIPGFDADAVLPDFLRNSFEEIKVTLMPTNIDELSKIWAAINQPYRLSVAYEISLVEITPTPPPPVNGGIVLTTNLEVFTLDPPRLTVLVPASGALARVAGGNLTANGLTIQGFGFLFPGQSATVLVGGQLAAVRTSPPPTDTSLTVSLPATLNAGPQEDVTMSLNGRTGTPLLFTVTPWLERISPLRTALDPPTPQLTLTGQGFTNSPQAVRLDGPGGTTNETTFDSSSDTQAAVGLPAGLANGLYNVRIVLSDNSASNSRVLEVIPRLDSPIGLAVVTVAGNQVHQLTLNGARLNGSDARVLVDGQVYATGANATPNQLILTLGRLLDAGGHEIAIVLNGQASHTVELQV